MYRQMSSIVFCSSLVAKTCSVHRLQTVVTPSRKKKLIHLCLILLMRKVYFQLGGGSVTEMEWRTFGFVPCYHNTPITTISEPLLLNWFILKLCLIKTEDNELLVTWLLSVLQCLSHQSSRWRYMVNLTPHLIWGCLDFHHLSAFSILQGCFLLNRQNIVK